MCEIYIVLDIIRPFFYRVVGTEERIPIPLMDYILNVVRAELDSLHLVLYFFPSHYYSSDCLFWLHIITFAQFIGCLSKCIKSKFRWECSPRTGTKICAFPFRWNLWSPFLVTTQQMTTVRNLSIRKDSCHWCQFLGCPTCPLTSPPLLPAKLWQESVNLYW